MSTIDDYVDADQGGVQGFLPHHVAVHDLDRQLREAAAARSAHHPGTNVRGAGAIKKANYPAANKTTGPGHKNLWPTQRHNS